MSSPEELELSEKMKVEEAVRLLCSVTRSSGEESRNAADTAVNSRPGPSGLKDEGEVFRHIYSRICFTRCNVADV